MGTDFPYFIRPRARISIFEQVVSEVPRGLQIYGHPLEVSVNGRGGVVVTVHVHSPLQVHVTHEGDAVGRGRLATVVSPLAEV